MLLVWAVTAIGLAAGAAAEVVGGGEDDVWALHIEVFGSKGLARRGRVHGLWDGEFIELDLTH